MMMMSLATLTLLLASTAVTITNGRVLQLSNSDKQSFVDEHNSLRARAAPTAVNMKQMVTAHKTIKFVFTFCITGEAVIIATMH